MGRIGGLIVQLIAGAVGGSVVGAALKQYDLGIIGNLVVGIIGGGIGAQTIGALLGGGESDTIVGPNGFDLGTLITQFASGAFGGGGLVVISGLLKENMGGQKPA